MICSSIKTRNFRLDITPLYTMCWIYAPVARSRKSHEWLTVRWMYPCSFKRSHVCQWLETIVAPRCIRFFTAVNNTFHVLSDSGSINIFLVSLPVPSNIHQPLIKRPLFRFRLPPIYASSILIIACSSPTISSLLAPAHKTHSCRIASILENYD